MNEIILPLNDEELTQYFEGCEVFLSRLKQTFPKLQSIRLGDWIDKERNSIELIIGVI